MKDELYKEIGANYRFFLGWRHASFAGNLIILYGVITLCISTYTSEPRWAFLIPLCASPIGVLLWMIDVRTRALYHAAIRAGKELEGSAGGFYTKLNEVVLPPGTSSFEKITQTGAVNVFFLGSSIVLSICANVLFFNLTV